MHLFLNWGRDCEQHWALRMPQIITQNNAQCVCVKFVCYIYSTIFWIIINLLLLLVGLLFAVLLLLLLFIFFFFSYFFVYCVPSIRYSGVVDCVWYCGPPCVLPTTQNNQPRRHYAYFILLQTHRTECTQQQKLSAQFVYSTLALHMGPAHICDVVFDQIVFFFVVRLFVRTVVGLVAGLDSTKNSSLLF